MNFDKAFTYFLIVLLISVPTTFAFFKQYGGASAAAVVIALAIVFTRLADISSLELYSLKVKLERQSQQVEVTLAQLQKLAASLAKANLTQIAISGQMLSGLNTDYKFKLHDDIIDSLRNIKVADSDIAAAQEVWKQIYCVMLFDSFRRAVTQLNAPLAQSLAALPTDKNLELPSPDAVSRWLDTSGLKDDRLSRLFKAYASVWNTGSMADTDLIPFNQVLPPKQ